MFKSINTYIFSNSEDGKTISGSGIVTIINSNNGLIAIDGYEANAIEGGSYLFKSKVKLYTDFVTNYNSIQATVGLF